MDKTSTRTALSSGGKARRERMWGACTGKPSPFISPLFCSIYPCSKPPVNIEVAALLGRVTETWLTRSEKEEG